MSKKDKKIITPDDLDLAFQKMKILTDEYKRFVSLIGNEYRSLLLFRKELEKLFKNSEDFMQGVTLKMTKNCNKLKEIVTINSNIEETLCHVLLAIRQNEYLQAFVPNESDPIRKVVGSPNSSFNWHKDRV